MKRVSGFNVDVASADKIVRELSKLTP